MFRSFASIIIHHVIELINIVVLFQKLKEFRWLEGTDPETRRAKILRKTKWLISISRNTLVVLISSVIAYFLVEKFGLNDVFILTGEVEEGLPAWQLPWRFNTDLNNSTASNNSEAAGPFEIASDLGVGLVMLPLVSVMQQLAIAKFYTRKNHIKWFKKTRC